MYVKNARRYDGDIIVLPSVMLDKTGTRTLDGMTPTELKQALRKPVYFAGYLSDVHRVVFEQAADRGLDETHDARMTAGYVPAV